MSADDDRKPPTAITTTQRGSKRDVQFIVLQLEAPSVVQRIGFGKFIKTHPCNVAEFCIYGGMSPNPRYMELLCHGGLKNDVVKETFELCYSDKAEEVILPVQYIRIDAISAHGVNYNVSIWHVWLEGCNDPTYIKPIISEYEAHRTKTTSHLLLAHLRRTFLLPAFSTLLTTLPHSISSSFEHPLISALHTALVHLGSFIGPSGAERILEECLASDLFREWGRGGTKGSSIARWDCVLPDGNEEGPGGRAGHQMVRVGRKVLLHGGWDGTKDLGDLWECELPRGTGTDESVGSWRCLYDGEEDDEDKEIKDRERPRARSCHQMAVDGRDGWVYLIGGMAPKAPPPPSVIVSPAPAGPAVPLPIPPPTVAPSSPSTNGATNNGTSMDVEEDPTTAVATDTSPALSPSPRPPRNRFANDFWRYKAVGAGQGRWELISEDVTAQGGPKLLFDHQMVVHSEARMLYVFGGKHADAENQPPDQLDGTLSGMYAYDLDRKCWFKLFSDPTSTDQFRSERLLSRIGHSMLFDPAHSSLYVLAGQRGQLYHSDLWAVKLASCAQRNDDSDDALEGEPGFWRGGAVLPTATTPTILSTKLVQADYTKDGGPPAGFTQRATIDVELGEWTLLTGLVMETKNEEAAKDVWTRSAEGVWERAESRGAPKGRYASQVVYDPLRKEHFMMGGHDPKDESRRLNDFWRLRVQRPSGEEALRMAKFLVRKQRFTEMCKTQPTIAALTYLQTTLSAVVDHTDEAEASAFRACMAALLSAPPGNNLDSPMDDMDDPGSPATEYDDSRMAASTSSDFATLSQSQRLAPGAGEELDLTPELYAQRHALFEHLLDFFPDSERQPREDLRDLAAPKWDQIGKGRFD